MLCPGDDFAGYLLIKSEISVFCWSDVKFLFSLNISFGYSKIMYFNLKLLNVVQNKNYGSRPMINRSLQGGKPMNVELQLVKLEEREILSNLLEKYEYEFSQYDNQDVNKLGLYGYQYLDYYWTEKNRWAYFIIVDEKLAGFVMVIDLPEVDDRDTDFQIAEFFVMYKYRRTGVGKQAFFKVLDLHKGKWQLKRHPKNLSSVYFWNKVINEYTNGNYELVNSYPRTEYDDGTLADVFFFNS